MITAVAVVALAGCAVGTPDDLRSGTGHLVEGGPAGQGDLRLTVRDAASRIVVRTADLPGLLYRVSSPPGAGLAPAVTADPDGLRLRLRPTGTNGPDTVTILLSSAVRWDLRLPAGAGEQELDLAGGRLRRIAIGAGGLITLRLPPPRGTVPVVLPDGAGDVAVTVPPATKTLIRLRGGAAGDVSTPWWSGDGRPAGAVLAARGWTGADDRYAVDARAGLGSLSVR
ncbi:hypothetical protein [Mangrovihabitans endophyticus]|uniref:Uncharacterized protein n=1 Tax=Mangrovihabitans endophyticus TaxID=1751298 RepID=A0A8J3FMR5_9ACTN|nr:hypothetical protein [Mangrovihabitans endophyticus]GGK85312.1 hypothetical protein GCM10012284_19440 [Mangrovihabitans endophyticus]